MISAKDWEQNRAMLLLDDCDNAMNEAVCGMNSDGEWFNGRDPSSIIDIYGCRRPSGIFWVWMQDVRLEDETVCRLKFQTVDEAIDCMKQFIHDTVNI